MQYIQKLSNKELALGIIDQKKTKKKQKINKYIKHTILAKNLKKTFENIFFEICKNSNDAITPNTMIT